MEDIWIEFHCLLGKRKKVFLRNLKLVKKMKAAGASRLFLNRLHSVAKKNLGKCKLKL